MEKEHIGELEELILLLVIMLKEEAYGVQIQKEISKYSGRSISRGALHSALSRLEDKGFLRGQFGEVSKKRGGKRKKYYQITPLGQNALDEAEAVRQSFQMAIQAAR